MVASSSFPVDSLRSPTLHEQVRRERDDHGLRAPELRRPAGRRSQAEGLHPPPRTLRRLRDQLGLPRHSRARRSRDDERTTLNNWLVNQSGLFAVSLRARSSTAASIRGRRPKTSATIRCKATDYALKNMRKVVPQLVSWTTRTGDDFTRSRGDLRRDARHVVDVHGPRDDGDRRRQRRSQERRAGRERLSRSCRRRSRRRRSRSSTPTCSRRRRGSSRRTSSRASGRRRSARARRRC